MSLFLEVETQPYCSTLVTATPDCPKKIAHTKRSSSSCRTIQPEEVPPVFPLLRPYRTVQGNYRRPAVRFEAEGIRRPGLRYLVTTWQPPDWPNADFNFLVALAFIDLAPILLSKV